MRPKSITLGAVVALIAVGALLGASAPQRALSATDPTAVPPNEPDKGLIYDSLVRDSTTCPGGFRLARLGFCTHGPDALPSGLRINSTTAPVTRAAASSIACDGNGVSGDRVQVMYVHAADVPDRYATYAASFRTWAGDADAIFKASAAQTGGFRRLRFVHDANCDLVLPDVTISAAGDDTFTATVNELRALGYNLATRKYLVFVDANVYCGIGSIYSDDRASATNVNNVNSSVARVDSGCWGGFAASHELMHNLGGVQLTAPNTSGGYHCTDESDVMCYSDSPNYPAMRQICDPSQEQRFDCNDDDYYNTSPAAGSYLATHWNSANSDWLIKTAPAVTNWAVNDSVDFDGDHKTDLGAMYRGLSPADSLWFAPATGGGSPFQIFFGATSDVPVPGDYNGDGKTDAVIFRPDTGLWYGPQTGAAQIVVQTTLGQAGDIPVPGDYDGDGKTDAAIWRPSTGLFFATLSGGGTKTATFGAPTDVPVPRDYDGDGKTDFAIYRADATAGHLGLWYAPLSGGGVYQIYFGAPGDVPVPGDYNGDGKAEAVIFREATGLWYGPYNGAPGLFQLLLGGPGDVPIPGYYDNNLTEDPAIYHKATGLWFSLNSGGGTSRIDGLGLATDVPIQKRPALAGGL